MNPYLRVIDRSPKGDQPILEAHYQKLISLMDQMDQKPRHYRIEYENALASALNRFMRDFLKNFGSPDGSIDWEKLLRLNDGKEKVFFMAVTPLH